MSAETPTGRPDRWWSRKPPDERRPILSSRLVWNSFEFVHPFKVTAVWGGVVVLALMVLTAVLTRRGDDTGDGTATDSTKGDAESADDADSTMPPEDVVDDALEIDGAPLPGYEDPDPAIGDPAPRISGVTMRGGGGGR